MFATVGMIDIYQAASLVMKIMYCKIKIELMSLSIRDNNTASVLAKIR